MALEYLRNQIKVGKTGSAVAKKAG